MMIDNLTGGILTITLYASECEQIATYLRHAAETGAEPVQHAETYSGLFMAAAMVCKAHGITNIAPDVEEQLNALMARVNGPHDSE